MQVFLEKPKRWPWLQSIFETIENWTIDFQQTIYWICLADASDDETEP